MERGPKGGFEAGQPIATEDAMNDMPENRTAVDSFVDRINARVEDGTYTKEEADALIAKAQAKHEEKVQAEAEQAQAAAEADAYNAWRNMTPEDMEAHHDAIVNDFEGESERSSSLFSMYPRLAGETNEEYGARIHQISEATKQYQAENPEEVAQEAQDPALDTYRQMVEKRVENGDLKREEADAMLDKATTRFETKREEEAKAAEEKAINDAARQSFEESQEKAKMEMAERIRKEVPEALQFLEKHPELKTEMTAAVKKLEELEAIANAKEESSAKLDEALNNRNETFMKAVEAFNAAARANEAARAKMNDLEQRAQKGERISDDEFKAVEEEIHKTEADQAQAKADKEKIEADYNEQEAAIKGNEEKVVSELENRMNERDKLVDEEREYYNTEFGKAQEAFFKAQAEGDEAGMAAAKAKMAELKEDQQVAANTMEDFVDFKTGKKSEEEYRQAVHTAEGEEAPEEGAAEEGAEEGAEEDAEEGAAEEAPEEGAAEDGDVEIREKADEDVEAGAEDLDDDFENEEQKGLFNKLKGFFNRNKRVKDGAEKATQKIGWKKKVYAAILALVLGSQIANFMGANLGDKNKAPENPIVQETEEKADFPDDLSLEVDLNAEKGEELSDLVDATSYGEDIEVNISYGDYDGSSEFYDYDVKHGRHNLTAPLYDMEHASELTNVQKAEQIAEGLANVLDDPVEQGQFAAIGGTDVVIGDREGGITSLDDMNEVLDLAQQDDEFRIALADYNKETYRNLVDNYDLQVEHRDAGTFHYSLYAYEMQLEDGTSDINYAVDKDGVINQEAIDVLQFMDENNQNVLDSNEIGGYKYNFLKAVGIIPADATDEEAQDIMKGIRIIGFSGKCGQLIWERTPDTGSEATGDEGTGSEPTGDEGTGSEPTGEEGTGSEPTGEEGTGVEPTGEEGTGVEPTGEEGTGVEPTGEEGTGDEPTGDELKPKTEETVASDDWDQQDVTDYDEATRGEEVVTEQDTGRIDQEQTGQSSNVADENFLNGGDQGGGNTDADGGGSTNPETEARYDGTDTSGYNNGAQQEAGTQTINELTTEQVSEYNNSQAAEESKPDVSVEQGDNNAPSDAEKANMMNDMF
jgi:hypothetical protein